MSESDGFKTVEVFESGMTVDAEISPRRLFDTGLLNHIIQFPAEARDDLIAEGCTPKTIDYRVIIQVREDT